MNNVRFVIKSSILVTLWLVIFCCPVYANIAIALPDSLQQSLNNAPNDSVRAQKMLQAATFFQEEDNMQLSLEYLNKALALSANNFGNKAFINYRIASVYFQHDDYLNSIKTCLIASDFYKKNKDEIGQANSLLLLGNNYFSLSKNKESEAYYKQAMDLYRKYNKQDYLAMCANNIANLFFVQGKYKEAKENYEKALAIHQVLGDKEQVNICENNIAIVYISLKQYEAAEKLGLKVLKDAEVIQFDYSKTLIYNTLSEACLGQKKYKQATEYGLKSRQIAQKIQSTLREKEALETLKKIAIEQNNYKKAFEYLEEIDILKDSISNEEITVKIKQIEAEQSIKLQKTEIESLQKDKKIQQEILDNEQLYKYLLFIFLFFIMLILLMTIVGLRRMMIYNKRHKEQKEEANLRNKELEQNKEEIIAQSEFLRKLNDEFYQLNLELLGAMREIEQKNEELNTVNENLDGLVKQRTQEIAAKNKRILEFVFMCAHQFRAPVARILGLGNLLDFSSLPENETDLLVRLKAAAQELDEVVRQMQQTLEGELENETTK
ncbi:Tetratricopeptide repeat-containing protein [Flexibacter flexilis DSM 6793]|uniref:Tetratricopeptide repeat-containing protein n=1 Tax=Flexibacter flexilis DSM 6793 TaxID=927664 RepID=A0A1I1MH29_9BACT|nr:tetratricopeptide repeat protein [Flexibacter flexilis]SFC84406.1 Tetratricopeptide repeat-containing protein [Flexibacter flexilis DSM 6793]